MDGHMMSLSAHRLTPFAGQHPGAERSRLGSVTGRTGEVAPRSWDPAKDTKVAKTLWP
jgi:hypothetical protein